MGRPIPLPTSLLGSCARTPTVSVPGPNVTGSDREQGRVDVPDGDAGDRVGGAGAATANGQLIAGAQQAQGVLREGGDDAAALAALADDHPGPAGGGAGPHRDRVADAGLGGQRVAGRRVGVDQAGAGGGMVGRVLPDAVAEPDAEHDAAVADRDVGGAVGVDAVRVGSDARLLDGGRQVHVDEPEGRRRRAGGAACGGRVDGAASGRRVGGHACSFCGSTEASTARLASGSSMMVNASAGPLMIVDGPGP